MPVKKIKYYIQQSYSPITIFAMWIFINQLISLKDE